MYKLLQKIITPLHNFTCSNYAVVYIFLLHISFYYLLHKNT